MAQRDASCRAGRARGELDQREPVEIGRWQAGGVDAGVIGDEAVGRVPRKIPERAARADGAVQSLDQRRFRKDDTGPAAGRHRLDAGERVLSIRGEELRVDGDDPGVQAAEQRRHERRPGWVDENRPLIDERREVRGDRSGLVVELAERQGGLDALAVRQKRECLGIRTLTSMCRQELRERELAPAGVGIPDALGRG